MSVTQNFVIMPLPIFVVINSRHKGILSKDLGKNFFEENRMWRFEYKRRRLNSNKESHWL